MNLLVNPRIKRFGVSAAVLFASLSLAIPAFAGTPINKTVAAAANARVHISSVAGSVQVTAWNRNQIHVSGTLSAAAQGLDVASTANGVDIQVILPRHASNDEGSHLVVQVPAASRLDIGTVSADIAASGLTGTARLESVSGNVNVASRATDIHAKAISGDVSVTGSAPDAKIGAFSINGEIRIANINGNLQASSTSGDIQLTGGNQLQSAQLDTTSGDIEVAAALTASGDYEFHSVSGNVVLTLPRIPSASFDASSLSGDIATNFGPAPQRVSEYGPGKAWHYQNGSGKADVRIHTLNGDIRIHALKH